MKILKFILFILLIQLAWQEDAGATIWYVDSASTAVTPTGLSWASAMADPQDAIDSAAVNDTIYIAQGTYIPNRMPPSPSPPTSSLSRYHMYHFNKNLKIYGGFPSGGGMRNHVLYPTILSGNQGDPNQFTDNSSHVLIVKDIDTNTVIDGLTIRDGYAATGNFNYDFTTFQGVWGGGLFVESSSINLRNLIFMKNRTSSTGLGSGGALRFFGTSGTYPISTIENCVFYDNFSASGGALAHRFEGEVMIKNCVFADNVGFRLGAAIVQTETNITNSVISIVSSTFYSNQVSSAYWSYTGGTISKSSAIAQCSITNCIFWDNTCNQPSSPDILGPGFNVSYTLTQSGSDYDTGTAVINNMNPLFINTSFPTGDDGLWFTVDDGLIVDTASPANGAGTAGAIIPAYDIIDSLRDIPPSLGAYKSQVYIPPCNTVSILYVDSSATGTNSGLNWTNAFTDLQDALNCADAGDTILIAKGTYYPSRIPDSLNQSTSFTYDAKYRAFHYDKDLKIYGGFPSGGGVFSARDWELHQTIFSGNIGSQTNENDNCFHVLIMLNQTNQTIMDGLYVTEANNGIGIYSNQQYNSNSINDDDGGGIYALNSSAQFTNMKIHRNETRDGAGIYSRYGSPIFENVTFQLNDGGDGGGAFIRQATNCQFRNVVFDNNDGSEGGAVALNASTAEFTNCIFSDNYCFFDGGAMHVGSSSLANVKNSVFYNNEGRTGGGAIYSFYGDIVADNCTFYLNRSTTTSTSIVNGGGAIFIITNNNQADIKSSIFWGNTSVVYENDIREYTISTPMVNVSHCITQGGSAFTGATILNNINPLFIDSNNAIGTDGIWMTADDGLQLTSCSYPINAGDTVNYMNDILDSLHIGTPDLGAYEFQGASGINITAVVDTACDSYVYSSSNGVQTFTASGIYYDTLTNAAGCDSIVNLDITILPTSSSTITDTVCDSYIYTSSNGSFAWTASGTYYDTLINASGCDSVITINLTINNSTSSSISATACDSYTSPSNIYTWTMSGTYNDTLTNASGCDSVITINLTINNSTSSSISATACDSYTSPSSTYTWTSSGTYQDTLTNASGCDSVITINLTINNSSSSTISATACDSYTAPSSTYTWTTSGIYQDTLTNASGCDSVITINLTINTSPTISISALGSTNICSGGTIQLTASGGASYTWNPGSLSADTIGIPSPGVATYYSVSSSVSGCAGMDSILISPATTSGDLSLASSSNASSTTGTSTKMLWHPNDGMVYNYHDTSCNLLISLQETSGGASLGNVMASVTVNASTPSYQGQPYVARWYEINPQNQGPATVTLYFTDDDFYDYNQGNSAFPDLALNANGDTLTTNLAITQVSGGALGVGTPTVHNAVAQWNSINQRWEVSFAVSGFSQFYIHTQNPMNAALPVQYKSFSVSKEGTSDLLNWVTQNEHHNSHFNVQRSLNGVDFVNLGRVNSKSINGMASNELTYRFIDHEPQPGHNYYRLEQVDQDNNSNFSEARDIIWNTNGSTASLYPNPVQDNIYIDLNIAKATKVDLTITNINGQTVLHQVAQTVKGLNHLQMDISELAQGIYIIKINAADKNILINKIHKVE